MYNNPLNLQQGLSGMGVDPSMFGMAQGNPNRLAGSMAGRPLGLTMDSVYGRKNQGNNQNRKYKDFNTSLFKTELCRSFSQAGRCTYGARCQFSHGKQDLRPVVRHRKYKTDKCRNFLNGYCPYGNRCCFLHNESPECLSKLGVNVNGVKVTINDQAPDIHPIGGVKLSGINNEQAIRNNTSVNNMKLGQMQAPGQMGMNIPQNMRGRIGVPGNNMANGPGLGGMMNGLNPENMNGQDMSFMLAQHHQLMAQYYTSQAAASVSMGHERGMGMEAMMGNNMQMTQLMQQLATMQLRADAAGLDLNPLMSDAHTLMSLQNQSKNMDKRETKTPSFNVHANYTPPPSVLQKIQADKDASTAQGSPKANPTQTPTGGHQTQPGTQNGTSPPRDQSTETSQGEQTKSGVTEQVPQEESSTGETNKDSENKAIDNLFATGSYNSSTNNGMTDQATSNDTDAASQDVVKSSIKMLGLDS